LIRVDVSIHAYSYQISNSVFQSYFPQTNITLGDSSNFVKLLIDIM
jgi:hypothetical protein